MLALALGSFAAIFFMAGSAVALGANATITDAATLVLDGLPYRLHGIDAPETDQICLKDDGTIWGCGIEARDKVREFVSTGAIKCESLGFDARYRNRRIGRCWVDGAELNDWIVRQGWALNSEPHARGRFKPAEAEAKSAGRGLWKGCFALPKHWRYSEKQDAVVQGSGCQANDSGSRERLFTRHPSMPAGCSIKGKEAVRAHITGHVGIYHVDSCKSYGALKNIDRWFCTEEEAQAEGYRKAFSCRK